MPKENDETKPAATTPERGRGAAATQSPPKENDETKPAASVAPPKVGDVIEEDEDFETVVVRRKKAAKPTGRFVAKTAYRCEVEDPKAAKLLEQEGAHVHRHAHPESKDGTRMTHTVYLHPGLEEPKGYTLPEHVAEHGLKHGALELEVR